MTVLRAALLVAACGSAAVAGASDAPGTGRWTFRALLDGKPIGEHRFVVTPEAGGLKVESVARFDVKFLMVTAYRYRHQATEHWRGDCLDALSARTDDDGQTSRVEVERAGDALAVDSPEGPRKLGGCVMSFAYWNPDMRRQSALLNAQTGRYETVRIEALPAATLDVAAARPTRCRTGSAARHSPSSSGIRRRATGWDSMRKSPAAAHSVTDSNSIAR